MITLTLNDQDLDSLLSTVDRVISQESDIVHSKSFDESDAIDSDAKKAYDDAVTIKNLFSAATFDSKVEKQGANLVSRLHQSAFVYTLNDEFNEYPLQVGKMVFFIDKFTEELTEIRCLKPDGTAMTRDNDNVDIPSSKEQILVLNEAIW